MQTPLDLADIAGQDHVKRALEVAATGGHSLALVGPPGVGKSLLSRTLSTLLPPLEEEEYQRVAQTWQKKRESPLPSALTKRQRLMLIPPPTISPLQLAGDGSDQHLDMGALASSGVLCLDRLDRFLPEVVTLLPALLDREEWATVQLLVTLEPCPCGFFGDPVHECRCTPDQIAHHQGLVSGVLERIAMAVEVPRLDADKLAATRPRETSDQIRQRVLAGSARARSRQTPTGVLHNAHLDPQAMAQTCLLDASGQRLLRAATQHLHLSPRGYHQVLQVARTIADLADSAQIQANHLAEAIQYRPR